MSIAYSKAQVGPLWLGNIGYRGIPLHRMLGGVDWCWFGLNKIRFCLISGQIGKTLNGRWMSLSWAFRLSSIWSMFWRYDHQINKYLVESVRLLFQYTPDTLTYPAQQSIVTSVIIEPPISGLAFSFCYRGTIHCRVVAAMTGRPRRVLERKDLVDDLLFHYFRRCARDQSFK